jgi:hypothetical protein
MVGRLQLSPDSWRSGKSHELRIQDMSEHNALEAIKTLVLPTETKTQFATSLGERFVRT